MIRIPGRHLRHDVALHMRDEGDEWVFGCAACHSDLWLIEPKDEQVIVSERPDGCLCVLSCPGFGLPLYEMQAWHERCPVHRFLPGESDRQHTSGPNDPVHETDEG